jgi:hypothetical protein
MSQKEYLAVLERNVNALQAPALTLGYSTAQASSDANCAPDGESCGLARSGLRL